MPKVMRGAPELTSMPTRPSSSAEQHHRQRLGGRAMRQHHRADQAEHHQTEIFGRVEFQRERRQRHAKQAITIVADRAGDERGDGGDRQRRAGAALLRHLVAVDAGDDRRGFARHVDEDRGGRAAILRAVEDAGQHDHGAEAGDRPKVKGSSIAMVEIGAMPGSTPTSGADQHADQAEQQIVESRAVERPIGRLSNRSICVCRDSPPP